LAGHADDGRGAGNPESTLHGGSPAGPFIDQQQRWAGWAKGEGKADAGRFSLIEVRQRWACLNVSGKTQSPGLDGLMDQGFLIWKVAGENLIGDNRWNQNDAKQIP